MTATAGDMHLAPPTSQWTAFGAEAVIGLGLVLCQHHGIDWPSGIDAEATETTHNAGWPRTWDDDWCGEHEFLTPFLERSS